VGGKWTRGESSVGFREKGKGRGLVDDNVGEGGGLSIGRGGGIDTVRRDLRWMLMTDFLQVNDDF